MFSRSFSAISWSVDIELQTLLDADVFKKICTESNDRNNMQESEKTKVYGAMFKSLQC